MPEPLKPDEKAQLHLSKAEDADLQDILQLFQKLTGREPTAQEIEEARAEWDAMEAEDRPQ